ncbi:MAG: ABC transporter permease [Candidatus Dadabacteria bacterium]|nr:ABC transporter permease [Candidatus Dadabacteria bacterium]NIS07547.1 ABC transporter permease [Candidatus Dadabacteria bacterium]NIY21162.1 MlaE family lipid ABC transporter permease subunit [Candidatus Dadabacteria bacterium]
MNNKNLVLNFLNDLGDLSKLLYKTIIYTFKPPIEFRLIVDQIYELGFKSIPIVILSAVSIGMVMVVQMAYGFTAFGAKGLVGPLVTLAIVRELGPILASLLVGGRVGSGITAEIGSMNVTEQLDAMKTLGADPVKKLVVPRFIACIISFPFLSVIADLAGIAGAMLIAFTELGVTPRLFMSEIVGFVLFSDFLSGILKTVFFGLIVAIIACYIGMKASGGTQGVGNSTTKTVVVSLVLIIIADFFLTKIFLNL